MPSARTASGQTEALKKTHAALGAHIDTHETFEKGHGWIQTRTLTASTALTDYLACPGLAQGNSIFTPIFCRTSRASTQTHRDRYRKLNGSEGDRFLVAIPE